MSGVGQGDLVLCYFHRLGIFLAHWGFWRGGKGWNVPPLFCTCRQDWPIVSFWRVGGASVDLVRPPLDIRFRAVCLTRSLSSVEFGLALDPSGPECQRWGSSG